MKLTNKHGLPTTIINVLKRPQYSKGAAHISATELLSSPRIVQMRRRHWDEIEEDAADMVWSLFGSALHNVLEHGKDEHHIVEERLFLEVDGWTLSGAIDLQEVEEDGVIISDYKCTSVWSVMNEKLDWQRQLNVYAYLVEKVKGLPVKAVQIVAILRDWSAREADTRDDYPPAPIVVVPILLWDVGFRETYIKKRINLHSEALFAAESGSELAHCTPDDCWEKPTTFAIKKKGNKRATLVLKTEEEALHQVSQLGETYVVERRPGERTRCERFCTVSPWCEQYAQYKDSSDD
jgi:RecB family exonuclease